LIVGGNYKLVLATNLYNAFNNVLQSCFLPESCWL